VAVPAKRKNLASLVDDFERHGSDLAIVGARGLRQSRTTYAQLADLSRRFAGELVRRDIGKGDRVLLWGENRAEWVAAFFGCVLRGVLPVPLDAAGARDFAQRVTAEVSPALIIADQDKLRNSGFVRPTLSLEELGDNLPDQKGAPIENLTADDPLQIVFTSGTTGDPKGVVHTHANVLASLMPIEGEMQRYLKYERLFHPIRILHTLPLSHVFGQFMGLWIPPLFAAEVHYQSRLVASEVVAQIKKERISVLATVPRVLDLVQGYLLRRLPDLERRVKAAQHWNVWRRYWHFRDVHRLLGFKFWAFVCGGASLTAENEHFWNTLGFGVIQGYGMTETTALVSLNHPFHAARGTIGRVLPGREVKLNEEGEVLVRGKTISNAVWRGGRLEHRDSEWLPTGDLADFDAQGNLRFRGRKKDLIVTSAGLNIHPEDLEAALMRQPGVKTASVVESDTDRGPEPHAVLILRPEADATHEVSGANRELSDFQQIRHWSIWPEPDLPRTSTGKVLRREVAKRLATDGMAGSPAGDRVSDLNLDSLGRVQLQAQLEQRYGIELDDVAIQNAKNDADVQRLIEQTATAGAHGRRDRVVHYYPRWPWNPLQQAIRSAFLEAIAMPLVRLLAKPVVTTAARQWPRSPMLIVANHITSYDAAFVLFALPGRVRRKVAIAMSGEMLMDFRRGRNQGYWFLNLVAPIAYFLMTALFNVFPLPQLGGFRESFRHAGEAVDRGYSVLVFPEGRRSDDGTPQPFKTGAGLLWQQLRVPALPVYLSGLGELKAHGGRWFRSGKIGVRVGEILSPDNDNSPEQLTDVLRRAVFNL
jgi:long-chain acyl-CoA synthetase